MCTYSYSVGYSCYYTFSIHETVTWDGCGCNLGSGSSCGRLEDCSVCKNPTFRYSSSSCGITNTPTNTPIVTPTFTKTPTPTPTSIVTPTCNPNFTLNATPACNKENFSITNYPVVNKPISNSVKKVGGSVDAFPGCDFSNVHTTGASCDLTETVSFDWIHSYQTCTSPTNCSQTCTKTIQKLNDVPVTPTCPPTVEGSCWATPQPAYFDSNINFLGNYPGQPEQFKNISVSSDGYACGAPSTSFFKEKTTITSACGTPIPNAPNYDLGLSFNYSIPACPGLLSNTCSCNVSADPSIYPGFLQTENGDQDDDIDLIDAFIITKNFVSDKEYSDDQLIVNGGLVVGGNSSFFRNINYNPNYQSFNDTPSELLKYEGARFISKFNKILKVPTSLTIKETN